jgi:hypothetical protein
MNKKTSFIISLCCVLPIIWASRVVARCHGVLALRAALVGSLLASGYALRGWCASRLLRSRGRFGGSATMRFAEGRAFPLAKNVFLCRIQNCLYVHIKTKHDCGIFV